MLDAARGYLELARPVNSLAAGVLTFIGAYVAGGALESATATGAAILATIFATAAGMAINDYFDREIDAINDPDRPIPRGAVSPPGALGFSLALFALAIALALALPRIAIFIAAINLVALVSYTEVFKGLPGAGNAIVAYLGGSTFLFGGAAVGEVATPAVLFVLAALSTFAREVVKDVEDVAGDREEGLRTLPIAVGERPALGVATGVSLVAVMASPVPYLLGTFDLAYLVVVLPADGVMLYATYRAFESPAESQRMLKYAQFLAALAFVVGRLAA